MTVAVGATAFVFIGKNAGGDGLLARGVIASAEATLRKAEVRLSDEATAFLQGFF